MTEQQTEHRKYYNPEGKVVPSCTTVIKLLNKPELVTWANIMGFRHRKVEDILATTSTYGTYCHSIFEQFFSGIIDTTVYDSEILSKETYLLNLSKFEAIHQKFQKLEMEVIGMELPLEGNRFGGTLDMLAYSHKLHRLFLFDLKTSKSMYHSHLIQLGGYSLLLKELYDLDVTDVGIILLSKSPNSKDFINIVSREDNENNEQIFLRLLDIYELMNGE